MASGQLDYTTEIIATLSDLSLAKLDVLTTAITRIQSLSGSVVIDYSDTTNNKAYCDSWPEYPPTTAPREIGTEFTTEQYSDLALLNNSSFWWNGANGTYTAEIFRLKKPSEISASGGMIITYRAKLNNYQFGLGGRLYAYIWNKTTSLWEVFNNSIPSQVSFVTITKDITNSTNYIDRSSYVYVLAVASGLNTSSPPDFHSVGTDYIEINFTGGYYNNVIIYTP